MDFPWVILGIGDEFWVSSSLSSNVLADGDRYCHLFGCYYSFFPTDDKRLDSWQILQALLARQTMFICHVASLSLTRCRFTMTVIQNQLLSGKFAMVKARRCLRLRLRLGKRRIGFMRRGELSLMFINAFIALDGILLEREGRNSR